ncbi:MAG: ABC-type transport auxiliary lipoprotein family protein [Thermodesulfobacteriota bacterium]
MSRHFLALSFILALILILPSCARLSQPSPRIEYFTLEYDPPPAAASGSLPWVIKVERFSAAPFHSSTRIIYRDRSYERNAYTSDRWRSTPPDLVSYFLARDLQHSGLFKAVLPYDTGQPYSHVLEGSVDEFLEWDREDSWEAVLTFTVTLMVAREPDISKRVLFQKTYRSKMTCRHRNPRALAEAMSLAMADLSAAVIRDVHAALAK